MEHSHRIRPDRPVAASGSAASLRTRDLPQPQPDPAEPGRPASPASGRALESDLVKPLRLSELVSSGVLRVHDLPAAAEDSAHRPEERVSRLLARRIVDPEPLYRLLSRKTGFGLADLSEPADGPLIDRLGALTCLTETLLPWRQIGETTVVAAATPEVFQANRARLEEVFGQVAPVLAPASAIAEKIIAIRGPELARRAETRVAQDLSCRQFPQLFSAGAAAAILVSAAALTFAVPRLLAAVTLVAIVSMVASMVMKFLAFFTSLAAPPAQARRFAVTGGVQTPPAVLPVVSVIVALYHEDSIAPRLIRRLGRLDYPKEKLDVILVVEQDDSETRDALDKSRLPPWMRVVVAPEGQVKTKPRALNFALDFCRGSIVGVYDAEDAPEPNQIARVAAGFAAAGPEVVCLQGALDFYNPQTNWLARCFTLEYGALFRALLPGLERMRLPIPLGGTTLFFRRSALEELGAWDAWNVTEDADLGMRLARAGWRTSILPSATYEEANCRPLPWIKQRSRWLKGYMITYLSHMRAPKRLWRELGPRAFTGFQVFFLGTILQGLLAPVLWTWWLLLFGLPHPLAAMLTPGVIHAAIGLFLLAETANFAVGLLGLQRSGQKINPLWLLTLPAYFPLQSLAAWKALWEVLHLPFYWSKTRHGIFDDGA